MDPMYVLQPNYLSDSLENTGISGMIANRGLGVAEASSPSSMRSRDTTTAPEAEKDRLRIAKAREFGLTKQTVGF